jgi:flagellar hook-basal body complex protein FliE
MIVRGITEAPLTEASPTLSNLAPTASPELIGETQGTTFESVLGGLLAQASEQQTIAGTQSEALARGTLDDLHGTMIAVKEAEISLKLVGSVRNRLIEAFQEIWRTNV